MYSDRGEIRELAKALRLLANELERNPVVAEAVSEALGKRRQPRDRGKEMRGYPGDLDLYALYGDGGEEVLREALTRLDTETLKKVVSEGGFDPSQLALKWRKKGRLIELIVDRVSSRARIGEVFRS